jgi:hypothetical protein
MGEKRPFTTLDNEATGDASLTAVNGAGPSTKKRKPNGISKHKAKEGSIQYTKKRARNIERLLQKNENLPADVRKDLERELAAHSATVEDREFRKHRSAMITRYHKARFFGELDYISFVVLGVQRLLIFWFGSSERKKAMRLIKQVKRKIEATEDPSEIEALQLELHTAEVDEAYALHFPHAEPYISLYTNTAESKDDGESNHKSILSAERPPMWSIVEKAMEEGPEALSRLRERKSTESTVRAGRPERTRPKAPPKKPDATPRKPPADTTSDKANSTPSSSTQGQGRPAMNRRERRRMEREKAEAAKEAEEDQDDGGGFFEGL